MENLVIITKQNIDSYQLTEQTRNDILTYDDDNIINAYTRFEFGIDPKSNQLYARHIVLGRVKEWKQYPFTPNN